MSKLDPKQQAFLAAVRSDFGMFVPQAFRTLYPGKALELNWHIEAIVHALEQNLTGIKRRLLINLPPRHLKSFLISVAWPAHLLSIDPSLKVFVISYSDELARTIARDFKRLVESDWYRALFPHVRLTKVTENEVVTDQGGYRLALSVHGSITGRGADLIIVDDPCRPEEAVSDKARMAVNDWLRNTILSRLDDKRRSGLIVVMQRLHVNDLTGLLEGGVDYHKLAFPAIAHRDEVIELRNGGQHQRRRGEALHPQREDIAVLRRMRDEMGPFNFAAQYQQAPRTPDGQLFKRKYFEIAPCMPPIRESGEFFVSIDSALSTAQSADYSAISIVYIDGGHLYVTAAERGRWDYETLKERTLAWVGKLSRPRFPVTVMIERAGSGISLVQYLEKVRDPRIKVQHRRPVDDKFIRAAKVLPWFEAGITLVSVPGSNAWVEPYLNEFMCFPNGTNDDQVDSLVQLLHLRWVVCLLGRR
jgi:predicted phage terminase large subunit-like protein